MIYGEDGMVKGLGFRRSGCGTQSDLLSFPSQSSSAPVIKIRGCEKESVSELILLPSFFKPVNDS